MMRHRLCVAGCVDLCSFGFALAPRTASKRLLVLASSVAVLLPISTARAETWAFTNGTAFWGDAASWTEATVPNAIGATATFTNPNGTRTVSLGGTGSTCPVSGCNFTVGTINFANDSSFSTTIRNGTAITDAATLAFDAAGAGPATINATGTGTNSNLITATMVFQDNVVATVATGGNSAAGFLSLTGDTTGPGGLTKEGPGTLTMAFISGSSGQVKAYTGPTVVNAGRLRLSQGGAPSATSSVTVNSGGQIMLITGAQGTNTGIYTFGSSASTVIILNGTGLAANPGALRLEIANTPPTQVTNLINLASTSSINVNNLTDNILKLNNTVSGTGGLIVNSLGNAADVGSLYLQGANTYSGGTTVDLGSLVIDGPTATAGAGNVLVDGLSAGTAGKMIVNAGVLNAIADSATLTLTGGGTAGVADQGYVDLEASDTVGGLVLGGVNQAPGTYGSTSSAATFRSDEYFVGPGVLTVTPASLPGDYNHNGIVDAGDYVLWRKTPADYGGPGGYTTWRSNFGNPPGSGSSLSASAVPEGSTLSLVAILTVFLGTKRRLGNNKHI